MTSRNDIDALFRQIGGTSEHYREFAVPDFVVGEPAAPILPASITPVAAAVAAAVLPAQVPVAARSAASAAAVQAQTGLGELFTRLAGARPMPSGAT